MWCYLAVCLRTIETSTKSVNMSSETRGSTPDQKQESKKIPPTDSASRASAQSVEEEDYGYDFYPERSGRHAKTWKEEFLSGRAASKNFNCVANVFWCAKNSPMVRLLLGALKSQGCPFSVSRHVSCETCRSRVNGGFDPSVNQIVVCQNNSTSKAKCCSVLSHELIHMFDFCRAKVDFTKLEHLACTEIRAANLMHCSFMSAWLQGTASPFNIKQRHQECVKQKALMSILMVRDIPVEEAKGIVDKVFDRCYKDLEPIGRRPRAGKPTDIDKAVAEAYLYGYTEWHDSSS